VPPVIMTFNTMTFSITAPCITALIIMTIVIMVFSIISSEHNGSHFHDAQLNGILHKKTQHKSLMTFSMMT